MGNRLLICGLALGAFVVTLAFSAWHQGLWLSGAASQLQGAPHREIASPGPAPPAPYPVRPTAAPLSAPATAPAPAAAALSPSLSDPASSPPQNDSSTDADPDAMPLRRDRHEAREDRGARSR